MIKININGERLWSDLMTLGTIGALPNGGVDRLALTDGDRDARNLFAHWCREAGLSLTIDRIGNMFARRDGTDNTLPPVVMGSHLDTQSPGGKFDGILGALGALEVARTLHEHGISTRRPIEVVNWSHEEGARFRPGMTGSAVFAGLLDLETAYASTDCAGLRFGDELRRIRYDGGAPVGGRVVDSYFELHNEQGPLLEEAGITIGAVTHSHYSIWADVECLGENSHIQSMPMLRRRNALVGAAKLIEAIDRVGIAHAPAGSASAVVINAWPNNRIIIPHRVNFSYGIIHPDEAGMLAMANEIEAAQACIAEKTGLIMNTVTKWRRDPVYFPKELVELTEQTSAALGLSCQRMRTRSGHDAFNMVRICPTALIFVPSRDGISHSELEWTTPEHCTAGVNVLCHAVLQRANRV